MHLWHNVAEMLNHDKCFTHLKLLLGNSPNKRLIFQIINNSSSQNLFGCLVVHGLMICSWLKHKKYSRAIQLHSANFDKIIADINL